MRGDAEIRKGWINDELSGRIIQSIIKVHRLLGPGFVECIYKNALIIELKRAGLGIETEKDLIIRYEGHVVGCHRADLIVEGARMVELKAVEELNSTHYARLRSYLRAAGLQVGILVNFAKVVADFRRIEVS